MYFCDSNCICHLYFHRINFMLYIYFCDIVYLCFYVQSVEHFVDIGLQINIIIHVLYISMILSAFVSNPTSMMPPDVSTFHSLMSTFHILIAWLTIYSILALLFAVETRCF